MRGNKQKLSGFTLVEILVVMGVFLLVGIILINVFLLSLRSQRQSSYRQETLASLRFVMETIAQDIRTSEIDYSLPFNSPSQELNLRSQNGQTSYSLNSATKEIVLTFDGQTSSLTSNEDVAVFEMNFFIDPPQDPFIEERCNIDADCSFASQQLGGCTIDDPGNEFESGFCLCAAANDCQEVDNCSSGIGALGQNLCLPFDRQPRVTVVIGFEPAGPREADQQPIYLQTTVSSRIYKR